MKFLFDTDHISFFVRPNAPEALAIDRRVARHAPADFAFSAVGFHEQTLGAHNYVQRAKTDAEVIRGYELFGTILQVYAAAVVLPFDAAAAAVFAGLKAHPVRIATLDLRIAAIALARNLTLLTRNAKDFGKVPGLAIEDWTV